MSKNRRPQMPKRRNFVKKHMDQLHKPQTHRDHTKYDRYEDYLKDQLDDMVGEFDPDEIEKRRKEKFKAKLKGEEYDPDGKANWDEYQWEQHARGILNTMAEEIRSHIDEQIVNDVINDDND